MLQNMASDQGLHCLPPFWHLLDTDTKYNQICVKQAPKGIARTRMARLPWMIRTRFSVPTKFFQQLMKTNI